MLSRLQTLLAKLAPEAEDTASFSADERQLATAALLVEVATIDQHFAESELDALQTQLSQQFSLSAEDVNELINHARSESKESSSLYQFTQCINEQCDDKEKYELACHLWEIAYADGNIDKYEEYIIRKIADLIYLRHSEFIKAKHYVRDKH